MKEVKRGRFGMEVGVRKGWERREVRKGWERSTFEGEKDAIVLEGDIGDGLELLGADAHLDGWDGYGTTPSHQTAAAAAVCIAAIAVVGVGVVAGAVTWWWWWWWWWW